MLLRGPYNPLRVAELGYDEVRGYFVDTTFAGNAVFYDATCEDYDGIRGALLFLGAFDLLDGPVTEALRWVAEPDWRAIPADLRRIVRFIRRWREAAGER